MKNTYQKHVVTDKRFLARRQRREKAMVLMPLLSMLCFIIGFSLLVVSLVAFSNTVLMRWLQFSLLYLLAGSIFLAASLWVRGRENATQRNSRR